MSKSEIPFEGGRMVSVLGVEEAAESRDAVKVARSAGRAVSAPMV